MHKSIFNFPDGDSSESNLSPEVTFCSGLPCENAGTCYLDDQYGYGCICRDGYAGRNCQVWDITFESFIYLCFALLYMKDV